MPFIEGSDIGLAWLAAFEALSSARGELVNLAVNIVDPLTEDAGVRAAIESHLANLRSTHERDYGGVQSVHTVANTIFPISYYRPDVPGAADRFIKSALRAEANRRHARHRQWGTYLGRLVAYPARDGGETNQLQVMLDRLSNPSREWSDLYEMPIVHPGSDDLDADWEMPSGESTGAVLHGDMRMDARFRGGPCLAHVSLTLHSGTLSMMALYRRHSYVTRAYGNFVGLARLLAFLAQESSHKVGQLMIVTGHAVVDAPKGDLLERALDAAGVPVRIETTARALGASWSDLELPAAVG